MKKDDDEKSELEILFNKIKKKKLNDAKISTKMKENIDDYEKKVDKDEKKKLDDEKEVILPMKKIPTKKTVRELVCRVENGENDVRIDEAYLRVKNDEKVDTRDEKLCLDDEN